MFRLSTWVCYHLSTERNNTYNRRPAVGRARVWHELAGVNPLAPRKKRTLVRTRSALFPSPTRRGFKSLGYSCYAYHLLSPILWLPSVRPLPRWA